MKPILTLFFAFLTIATFAQKDFQGKATYMSKTTIDLDNFGGVRQVSEAQKKRFLERMKSRLEKTFILNFDKTSSLY